MLELGSADEEVRCDSSNNQNEIDLNDLVDENNHEIDPHENNENSNEDTQVKRMKKITITWKHCHRRY